MGGVSECEWMSKKEIIDWDKSNASQSRIKSSNNPFARSPPNKQVVVMLLSPSKQSSFNPSKSISQTRGSLGVFRPQFEGF
jgi:hypothetical protein